MLSVSDAEKLVHAFMTSRLDYCNALLGGCPASSINKLQIVQNAAARVLTRSRKYDHITPILQSFHWLPIKFRISYKILLLAYKALNDLAPAYLTNLLSRYNPTRSLRSQNSGLLVVSRIAKSTKGGSTFSYLAPKLWNSLPENVLGSDTLSLFKSRLKISLAKHSYNASHNLVLQVYLIKRTLLCFSLGWTNNFCLDGTTAMLIMSLFVSLYLPVTRNYTSFSLDPTLKWSEMTKHVRRDDANPSENIQN